MKKQIVLTFFLALIGMVSFAQERPSWIDVLPKPTNTTYYYVHAKGSGRTDTEANKAAMNDLNRQILDYLGPAMETKVEDNGETIYQIINGEQYRIQRKQVCDWSETASDSRTIQHYLFQVAARGNQEPIFDNYNCYPITLDGIAVLKSALLPGLGQFHKGQNAKGVGFLAGEVVSVTGIVVAQSMRHTYINKMNSTNNANLKKAYADRANVCTTVRNISIGAAAAVYVWNVLDAIISKNNRYHSLSYGGPMNLYPVVTDESVALSLSINF